MLCTGYNYINLSHSSQHFKLSLATVVIITFLICLSSRGSINERITVVTLQNKIGLFLGLVCVPDMTSVVNSHIDNTLDRECLPISNYPAVLCGAYQVLSYHYVCLRLSEQILLKYARLVQTIAACGISIRVLLVVKGRGRSSEFLVNYDVTLSVIMYLLSRIICSMTHEVD
jgi:hypothetical protein